MTKLLRSVLVAGALALGLAAPAQADRALPAPYVSRALDAVLIPINRDVRGAFGLARDDRGVVVLATEPGGVADSHDIWPGDVIEFIDGRRVQRPAQLDEIVWFWIFEGYGDFAFDIYRGGRPVVVQAYVDERMFWQTTDIYSVQSWTSWSYATSFSYSEYYTEYYTEIVNTYETYETVIKETTSSEEFYSSMTSEVTTEESFVEVSTEAYNEEVFAVAEDAADGTLDVPEEAYAADGLADEPMMDDGLALADDLGAGDGTMDEAFADEASLDEGSGEEEPGLEEEFVEEEAYEEPAAGEEFVEEEVYEEPAAAEEYVEEAYEEPAFDKEFVEEEAYEEPAFEEEYVEEAYEEPVYEEPAYEEPAYEEPAYEEEYVE